MTETDKAQTVTKRQIQRQNRKVMDKKKDSDKDKKEKYNERKRKDKNRKDSNKDKKRQIGEVCSAPPAYEADN